MKSKAEQLFIRLKDEENIVGEQGHIQFSLKNLSVKIQQKDSVGNLLQEWFKAWMEQQQIEFLESLNSQSFPDFFLNPSNLKTDLLEVKTFDFDRGPGFDLANFDSYCNSLLTNAYRLDSDYLIFAYQMVDGDITIKEVWLKKNMGIGLPERDLSIESPRKEKCYL